MKIALFGGAGFIGVNLTRALAQQGGHDITVIDAREEFFAPLKQMELPGVHFAVSEFPVEQDFDRLLAGMDVVYHLVSTTNPSTSNKGISHELEANIVATSRFLESCVRVGVGRVIFLSSGGTVYGQGATVSAQREYTDISDQLLRHSEDYDREASVSVSLPAWA